MLVGWCCVCRCCGFDYTEVLRLICGVLSFDLLGFQCCYCKKAIDLLFGWHNTVGKH